MAPSLYDIIGKTNVERAVSDGEVLGISISESKREMTVKVSYIQLIYPDSILDAQRELQRMLNLESVSIIPIFDPHLLNSTYIKQFCEFLKGVTPMANGFLDNAVYVLGEEKIDDEQRLCRDLTIRLRYGG